MRFSINRLYIQNSYEMLKYLYEELNNRRFNSICIDKCSSISELYALVIIRWCNMIARDGLHKKYITVEDTWLSSPKGQINVQSTIQNQSLLNGMVICSYDEFSENIYENQLLKGTLEFISLQKGVNSDIQLEVKKTLQLFNAVDSTDVKKAEWKDIKFDNSTMRYKHLLDLCRTYINESVLSTKQNYNDDNRLYILFKKQFFKFMKLKYSELVDVGVLEKEFDKESDTDKFEKEVFKKQRMVTLRNDKQALIYLVKLQDKEIKTDLKLQKQLLKELAEYLKEYKHEYSIKTYGCILYINTDRTVFNYKNPTMQYVDNNYIEEAIIDVFDNWNFVENKINDAYKVFIGNNESS